MVEVIPRHKFDPQPFLPREAYRCEGSVSVGPDLPKAARIVMSWFAGEAGFYFLWAYSRRGGKPILIENSYGRSLVLGWSGFHYASPDQAIN